MATSARKKKLAPKQAAPTPEVEETTQDQEVVEADEEEVLETDADGDVEDSEGDSEGEDGDADESDEDEPEETDADDDRLTDGDVEANEYRAYWQNILDESGVTPPKGRILFPGEPLTVSAVRQRKGDDFVFLTEDVYRMIVPLRAKRPVFTLEAMAGQQMSAVEVVSKAAYEKRTKRLLDEIEEND